MINVFWFVNETVKQLFLLYQLIPQINLKDYSLGQFVYAHFLI